MAGSDVCVIFNPAAGRGRAGRRLEALRHHLAAATFRPTQGPGQGEELALAAIRDGFRVVGAAGGDGTVHEVANGVLRAADAEAALAVFPIGSANDYAFSLGLGPAWWERDDVPAQVRTVDAGRASTPEGRERYFVNGLGLGFNGAVTLESRRIRWLRGVPLYALALLRALGSRYAAPVMTIRLNGSERRGPTLALTIALGQREGNFRLAPQAVLDDGLFDYLHAGALRRSELVRYLPGMVTGRLPTDHPNLAMGRCAQVEVESEAPLLVHVDGEFFCLPHEGIRALAVRLLPRALRVYGRWSDPQ